MRLALAAAALAAAGSAGATDWSLAQLFDALARNPPERAAFTERKFIALLDRPVDSSGEVLFTPPDRFEKRTLEPRPEAFIADRDTLTMERDGKRRTIGLRDSPQAALLVESIRETLAGDLVSLTRSYSATLDGDRTRWHLVLRPLDAEAARFVERIEMRGAAARLASVEIFQADGDRSVMTISPPATR